MLISSVSGQPATHFLEQRE